MTSRDDAKAAPGNRARDDRPSAGGAGSPGAAFPPAFSFGPRGWTCDEAPLSELAARHGTPLYCYGRKRLLANLARLTAAFPPPAVICYSVKANPNLAILRELAAAGAGFDVVSGGELRRVLAAGGAAAKTVFAGVGKTPEELREAVEQDLFMLNVESLGELERVLELARDGGGQVPLALRVNPDVDPDTHRYITTGKRENKFGIEAEQLDRALELLHGARGARLAGLHAHIGSQVASVAPYARAVDRLVDLLHRARSAGFDPRWINAGGGFAVSYDGGAVPGPEAYAAAILPRLAREDVGLVLEIGRAIVGDAGGLLTRVLYRKEQGDRRLLITDAGMNDLLRPALYGAWHHVWPVGAPPAGTDRRADSRRERVDVAGPICESSDYLARDRELPPVDAGDLLLVFDAGAYGMSMASQYNSHPRPAEVLVDGGEARLIRRRETFDDLVAAEVGDLRTESREPRAAR